VAVYDVGGEGGAGVDDAPHWQPPLRAGDGAALVDMFAVTGSC